MATETAPSEQAARERKVDAFVFDCVCHIFNFDPANAIGPPGQLFDEHLYAFHQLLTKEGEKVLSREEFMKEWSVDEIYDMVIEGSDTDMIVAQPLPLTDLFHDGLSPWEKCAEMAARHPDRAVFWGSVNPLEGKKALDLMTRQVEDHGAKAFKFYNVRYDYGQPFPWRMDDPRIAYPVFERAQELGVNLIGVHKGVPLGPQPIEHTRTFDMDGAAANFPDINFVIFHVGLPWLDEVLWQLVRYPNLYASIAATVNFISRQPRVFAETLGKMMWWCGEDKIIYGGESPIWHPQWALEAFWNFELPRDIVEERGYPQLTEQAKRKILGENLARLHGIDVEAKKAELGVPLLADHPATDVTYDEAAAFCAWAGGRLPTGDEWEAAARGDDGRAWPWGHVVRPRVLRVRRVGLGVDGAGHRASGGREPLRSRAARRQRLGVGVRPHRGRRLARGPRRLLPRPRVGRARRARPGRRPGARHAHHRLSSRHRPREAPVTQDPATITAALREVYDPCCADRGISIVDMGVVEDVRVTGAHVDVDLVLTTGWCPFVATMSSAIPDRLRALDGVQTVDVHVVWDPVWTPERLSPSARDALSMPLEELEPYRERRLAERGA